MTPFDQAWALLKAPLDYDSIEQVGEKEYNANFVHPDTGEIHPMVAQDFGLGYESGIYRPGQKPKLTQGSVLNDNHLSHLVLAGGGEDEKDYAWGVKTNPPHRRQGMATALYDMNANIQSREGDTVIVPAWDQSLEGRRLWNQYSDSGHWPRSQDEKEQMAQEKRDREASILRYRSKPEWWH